MAYQQILPAETELIGEFRILAHLGSGGFANTYQAFETSLGREVAIKEYFPSDLAVRADTLQVEAKTPSDEKHFKWGLRRFIREAKTLAKFRHPSIVRVHRVFEENDTAYIVMEYVTGSNMEAWLHALGRSLTQAECDRLLTPLLDALEVVHSAGILHRDIKPANIYIRAEDSSPVLLDFGSARHAAAEQAGTTAAIVSKGYSPHEAYTTDTKKQGPWTDIYGLAATIYRALSGQAPPESTSRMLEDDYASSATLPATQAGYRSEFLEGIDAALKVMPTGRPQSISDWRTQLFPTLPQTTIVGDQAQQLATTKVWQPISNDFSDRPSNGSIAKDTSKSSRPSRSRTLIFGTGLALLLVSAAGLFLVYDPAPQSNVQDEMNEAKKPKVSTKQDATKEPLSLPKEPPEAKPATGNKTPNADQKPRVKTAEDIFWDSVDKDNPKELQAYIDAFSDGKFVNLAQMRLARIGQDAAATSEQEHHADDTPERNNAANSASSGVDKASTPETAAGPPPHDCDRLAGQPDDEAGVGDGVPYHLIQVEEALSACRRALEAYPGTARFEHQLARALHRKDAFSEAITHVRSAAQKSYAAAINNLGIMYEWGQGVAKDAEEANRWYRKAADMGHARAMSNLGINLQSGIGTSKDEVGANRWYRKAADKGNVGAMFRLAVNLQTGAGIDKDVAEAVRWYRKAADKGLASAMHNLAWNLENGNGVPKDSAEANRWYRKAADKGYPSAMYNLALNLQFGSGIAKDIAEANRWYRKAAGKDHAGAMFRLALNLQTGTGIAKDVKGAIDWYRKASDKGHADAMYNLAWNLENGNGIAKNVAQANRWFRRAADKDHANAMYNLAWNLENGKGITKDLGQANSWYRKAVDKGHAGAMYALARMHDDAKGVSRDRPEAARLMFDALKKGHATSLKEMKTNARAWSKQFRRELQRLMRDAGVYEGAVDGSFGAGTRRAIDALAKNQ